jgi:hypothetical protein
MAFNSLVRFEDDPETVRRAGEPADELTGRCDRASWDLVSVDIDGLRARVTLAALLEKEQNRDAARLLSYHLSSTRGARITSSSDRRRRGARFALDPAAIGGGLPKLKL